VAGKTFVSFSLLAGANYRPGRSLGGRLGETMTEFVLFVALAFAMSDDGLAPRERVECPTTDAAIKRAEWLSQQYGNSGAIAFALQGGDLPQYEDAVLVRAFGEVPSDLSKFFNAKKAWDVRPEIAIPKSP